MTALPNISSFTGSTVTENDFKTALTDLHLFLSGLLGTAGTQQAALSTLGCFGGSVVNKTGAYTVLPGDRGKIIVCSGTFTLSLTAATTMGDGFLFSVINMGSGVITIDPSTTETINGATTLTIGPSDSAICVLNSTLWTCFLCSKYTLPTASASILGGVKIGSGVIIDGSGIISASSKGLPLLSNDSESYGVSSGTTFVNKNTDVFSNSFINLTGNPTCTIYRNFDNINTVTLKAQIGVITTSNPVYIAFSVNDIVSTSSDAATTLAWVSCSLDTSAITGLQQIKILIKRNSTSSTAWYANWVTLYAS